MAAALRPEQAERLFLHLAYCKGGQTIQMPDFANDDGKGWMPLRDATVVATYHDDNGNRYIDYRWKGEKKYRHFTVDRTTLRRVRALAQQAG